MKVYFAGPLFSMAEKMFNLALTEKIEQKGIDVFLPQRDGVEHDNPAYASLTKDERRNAIFIVDRAKIFECDGFLFVLDGRVPDEGACVELGIAYTYKYLQKKDYFIIGLHTDNRAAFLGSKLNPMIKVPLERVFETENALLDFFTGIMAEKKVTQAIKRERRNTPLPDNEC